MATPVDEKGVSNIAPTPSKMIRVDYQKTPPTVPTPAIRLQPLVSPNGDRNSASPVSSVQEEFYSYLGISSKSSGDSDAEPSTTTPTKSPLDDFDLSKRRSLRVRVVNKLKEHQAKLQKLAETSSSSSPDVVAVEETPNETGALNRSHRLTSLSSNGTTGGIGDPSESPNSSSTTILARRCYFIKSEEPSPSQTPSTALLSPQSASSPLFLSPVTPKSIPHPTDEVFADFEDEIKKHVELTARLQDSPTITTTITVPEEEEEEQKVIPSVAKKSTTKAKKQIITKRILIRRKKKFAPHGNRSSPRSNKWTTSIDAVNNNKRRLSSVSVRLKKFELKKSPQISQISIPVQASPLPEFSVVEKFDDVPPFSILDQAVKKDSQHGAVLGTYYCERQRILLVVAEKTISFFQHHTNVAMFQKVLSGVTSTAKNGTIPKPRCVWSQIDSVPRLTRDEPVKELLFEKRIMASDGKTSIVYVELRAQPLLKDRDYRTGEMSATYVNVYYLSRGCDDDQELSIEVRSVALDTIVALPEDICYTVMPSGRSLLMCWTERSVGKKFLGICKYTLSEDLSVMESAEEFKRIDGELHGLRYEEPHYVVGTGNNQISIWNTNSGLLLTNIYLSDFELGDTIYARVMDVDRQEKHLLLVQYWENYLNVVHVNLLDFSYRVLKGRQLRCTKYDVQSVVRVDTGNSANVLVAMVAKGKVDDLEGNKGEGMAQETLELFDALTNRLVVQKHYLDVSTGCRRLFLNDKYIIKVGDDLESSSISIQSMNEFLFNTI